MKDTLIKFRNNLPSAFYYFKKNSFKSLKLISLLVFSVSGLIISTMLVQVNQDIRSKARTIIPTPTPGPIHQTLDENPIEVPSQKILDSVNINNVLSQKRKIVEDIFASNVITQKVLVMVYHDRPYLTSNGVELDGPILSQFMELDLERGSKFHEYKGEPSPIQVDIQIAQTIVIEGDAPHIYGDDLADYQKIINDNNVCQKINNGDIDEVWIWTDGEGNTNFDEFVNAGPEAKLIPNVYPVVRPDCNRMFMIMGLNYYRVSDYNLEDGVTKFPSSNNAVHSFDHRIERVIAHYLDGKYDKDVIPGDNWYEFDGKIGHDQTQTIDDNYYCGNVHWAPNTKSYCQDYNYYLKGTNPSADPDCPDPSSHIVSSDCQNWNPQHLGQTANIDCSVWKFEDNNCFEDGYQIWWKQNMPGNCNTLTKINGQQMPNWWQLIYKFDTTAPYCDSIEPTPTLSPTPFPTATPTVYPSIVLNNITTSCTPIGNTMNWNSVPNSTEYEVWMCSTSDSCIPKSSPDGSGGKIASVTLTYYNHFNIPPGLFYRYSVRAKMSDGNFGPWSNIVQFTPVCPSPTPKIVTNSASGLSCFGVCANNNQTCFDIGTNTAAQNDKYWTKVSGVCTENTQSTNNCSYVMNNTGSGQCSNKDTNWTKCSCNNACRIYLSPIQIINDKLTTTVTNLSSFPVTITSVYNTFPSGISATSVNLSGSQIWTGNTNFNLSLFQENLSGQKTIPANTSSPIVIYYNTNIPQNSYNLNLSVFNAQNNSGCSTSVSN